jgi:hypothetical protein
VTQPSITLPPANVLHGVDFSGARDPRSKIWVATASIDAAEVANAHTTNGFTHAALVELISAGTGDGRRHLWLIDAPVSLSGDMLQRHGVGSSWDEQAAWLASCDTPEAWREICRVAGTDEMRRVCDVAMRVPFAPANLRIFRQTWRCIVDVLTPLRRLGAGVIPFDDPGSSRVLIAEGGPACVLRHRDWPTRGYKGREPARRETRTRIAQRLGEGLAEHRINLDPATRSAAVDDHEGDALDSLLLLDAAARWSGERLTPDDEGWIAG